MSREQLYASFVLDRKTGLEIALLADWVIEATPVVASIQPLPTSADFLEGIMQLRDDVIPVINLKKRFGLPSSSYDADAKVAVVRMNTRRYGLLFDDIREVLRVPDSSVERLDAVLMTEESVITDLIKLDQGTRTLELLDLTKLFPGGIPGAVEDEEHDYLPLTTPSTYYRYVVFECAGQEYGIAVQETREICFLADIDETFQSGVIEGALHLRGHTIPVLNGYQLLGAQTKMAFDDRTRILVMRTNELAFGLLVDEIREIIVASEDMILPVPGSKTGSLQAICQYTADRNILLLEVEGLLNAQLDKVKAMTRLHTSTKSERNNQALGHHLITENCYLIFSIGKNYAVELREVQEILETAEFLSLPDGQGLVQGVINLRGRIVPVLDLHQFYGSQKSRLESDPVKLIIGRYGDQHVALVVDDIVTIYKQEEFHTTPSLRPELQDKKDTLDRLIEFVGEDDLLEHVLVVNIKNIVTNHLQLQGESVSADMEQEKYTELSDDNGGTERSALANQL